MGGTERLKQKILEEALQQADIALEQAGKEAEAIMDEAREDAENKRREISERTDSEVVNIKKRMMANAALEARKKKLEAKQNALDEAFSKTIYELNSLPDERYRELLTAMIARSSRTGDEEIILSPTDLKRVGDIADTINQKTGKKLSLSAESRDINGGFILRSGNIEINNSFDAVIRMRRDELEGDAVKVLFGSGDVAD